MEARPSHLRDNRIDRLSPANRDTWVTQAVRAQVAFAIPAVPFWAERFQKAGIDTGRIQDLQDFARIPPLSKAELRALSPWELVPGVSRSRLYLCRSTSGTTGAPTAAFWTRSDWRALTETMARLLDPHRPDVDLIAFNGYHQAHAAAPAYDEAIRLLGGISIPRHYLRDDEPSTFAQLRAFGCNTLILAQRAGTSKSGRTVEDLLQQDHEFFARYGIRWWLGSSSTFTEEIRETARRQGVQSITNLYGSSEFGTLAVSCRQTPEEFHLALGHVLVEVVDHQGFSVRSGERGRIVVSHLLTSHPDGGLGSHEGTQLFRFENGDEATFFDEPCACGLSSPRIRDIRRSGRGSSS